MLPPSLPLPQGTGATLRPQPHGWARRPQGCQAPGPADGVGRGRARNPGARRPGDQSDISSSTVLPALQKEAGCGQLCGTQHPWGPQPSLARGSACPGTGSLGAVVREAPGGAAGGSPWGRTAALTCRWCWLGAESWPGAGLHVCRAGISPHTDSLTPQPSLVLCQAHGCPSRVGWPGAAGQSGRGCCVHSSTNVSDVKGILLCRRGQQLTRIRTHTR